MSYLSSADDYFLSHQTVLVKYNFVVKNLKKEGLGWVGRGEGIFSLWLKSVIFVRMLVSTNNYQSILSKQQNTTKIIVPLFVILTILKSLNLLNFFLQGFMMFCTFFFHRDAMHMNRVGMGGVLIADIANSFIFGAFSNWPFEAI